MRNKMMRLILIILISILYTCIYSIERLPFPESFNTNDVTFGFPSIPEGIYKYPLPKKTIKDRFEAEKELINKWQIPDSLQSRMTDKALIVTVLNNPFLMYNMSDSFIEGNRYSSRVIKSSDLEFLNKNFNGIAELYTRESMHKLLYKLYSKPKYRITPNTYSSEVKYICKTNILTFLLFSDEILSRLTKFQLIELFKAEASLWGYLNYNYRTDQEVKSNLFYNNPLNLIKILKILKYPPFLKICKEKVNKDNEIYITYDSSKLESVYKKFVFDYQLGKFNPNMEINFHKSSSAFQAKK